MDANVLLPFASSTLSLVFFVLLIALLSTYYQVNADEVGVVQRFGRYVRTTDPGAHVKIPLVESVTRVPVQRLGQRQHAEVPEHARVLQRRQDVFVLQCWVSAKNLGLGNIGREICQDYGDHDPSPFYTCFAMANPRVR